MCRHQAAHHRRAIDQHGAGAAYAGAAYELGSRQLEGAPHDIDEKRIGVIGERFDAAVDRHRAHLHSPGLVRTDFFTAAGLIERGLIEGGLGARTAPATSVRSMISRSLRKASEGCIA